MKQCIPVIEEEYDGELRFSIIESVIGPQACVLTLGGYDGDELVGFKIEIPLMTKRLAFKTYQFILPSGVVKCSSIGDKSDRLIGTLAKYFQPAYEPSEGFTEDPVEIDYTLRNQGSYDINQDKIYLKLYYDEEQDEDHADCQHPAHVGAFGQRHEHAAHPHDGRITDHAQAHGDEHLHLGDVVGGAGDEAGGGKAVKLLIGEAGDL